MGAREVFGRVQHIKAIPTAAGRIGSSLGVTREGTSLTWEERGARAAKDASPGRRTRCENDIAGAMGISSILSRNKRRPVVPKEHCSRHVQQRRLSAVFP